MFNVQFETTAIFWRRAALSSACGIAILLSACGGVSSRIENANDISRQGSLRREDIQAHTYKLASWQRITDFSAPIHVYIEGDGLAWLSRSRPSSNPTPTHATGLVLASRDAAPNVVYLARPCQFTAFDPVDNKCDRDDWTGKRFSKEIIRSYHSALDQIKRKGEGSARFHLIGYSGGANIAGLLAAQRQDILSLRSVAGNLDNDFFTQFHEVSAMPHSLNMADHAGVLTHVPQYHFIAEDDEFVPPPISKNYARKLPSSRCAQFEMIRGTEHIKGWEERWADLLASRAPRCRN